MAKSDVWFETPPMRDDYQLAAVDGAYLVAAVKPKQFLHINQAECILCEGCVDICPWKCIHYLSIDAIAEGVNVDDPGTKSENQGFFLGAEDEGTRWPLCIARCPTGVSSLGKSAGSLSSEAEEHGLAPWEYDPGARDFKTAYAYGVRW